MTEFAYNNVNNANIGLTFSKLNYGFYLKVFNKKKINSCSKSKAANEIIAKLKVAVSPYKKNFYYV